MGPYSRRGKSIKISHDFQEKDKELDSQELPLSSLQDLYWPSWFYKLTFTFLQVPPPVKCLWHLPKQNILNVYVCMYICVYISVYVCMDVYIYVCIYIYYIMYMYMCVYVPVHIPILPGMYTIKIYRHV